MSNPPAAWYEEPSGAPLTQRYWDGTAWTAHTRPVSPPPPPPPPSAAPQFQYVQPQPGASDARPYGQGFAPTPQYNPQNYAGNQVSYAAESVTFKEALRVYFSLKRSGTRRASIGQWAWSNFLFTPLIVAISLGAFIMLASYVSPPEGFVMSSTAAVVSGVSLIVLMLTLLVVSVRNIIITVRRLHDTGRPGTHMFISLVPLVGTPLLIYWLLQPGVHEKTRFDE